MIDNNIVFDDADNGGSQTQPTGEFNIELYGINADGNKTTGNILTCDATKTLFCKITVNCAEQFNTIKKAILRIRQASGAAGEFIVQLSDENHPDISKPEFNRTKQVVTEGVTYQIADIGYFLQNCEAKTVYLAIKSQSGDYCSLYTEASVYPPHIDIEYVEDDDFISNVPTIENTVGRKGKYSVNIRNGKLYYSQNIYSANGNRLPFNLSVTYNAADCDKDSPNDMQGAIKGWTFNYQQTLKRQDRKYVYLDGTHKYHVFAYADNCAFTLNDISACNGTILKTFSTPYEISDEKTTTLKFDQNNRLSEIDVVNGGTLCNTVAYDENGRIDTVTDGSGDVYSFSYDADKITLYKGLLDDSDKTALVELVINADGTLSSVENLLSQQIYTYTYTEEKRLASVKDSATAQLTEFEYTSCGSVKRVTDFVKKSVSLKEILESKFFTYKYLHTVVDSSRTSVEQSDATKSMGYFFNTSGELEHIAEGVLIDDYRGLSHINKTPFFTTVDDERTATVESFIFSYNGFASNTIDVQNYNLLHNPIRTPYKTMVLPTDKKYVFCGKACIKNLDAQLESLTATLIAGNGNMLCTLEFDPNQKDFQFRSKTFDAYPQLEDYYVMLNVGKTQAYALVGDFKILTSSTPAFCLDKEVFNATTHIEYNTDGQITWYEHQKCELYCNDEDGVEDIAFTVKDYLLTKLSMLKNPESYKVWFNDGKGMFENVQHTYLLYNSSTNPQSFYLRDMNFTTIQTTANKTTFTRIEPPEDNGNYLTTFFKLKTVANGVTTEQQTYVPFAESEEEYDQYYRLKKSTDFNGIETWYYYDNIGNVTAIHTNKVGNRDFNIVQTFAYNSDGDLSYETDYRNADTFRTTYTYNDAKMVASVTTPANQTINYGYTADNERLNSVSATLTSSNYTATNHIDYDGDLAESYTANDTEFQFTYNTRNTLSSVTIKDVNGSTLFSYDNVMNILTPWVTTTFGNGQKIRQYYDDYNRLIKITDATETEKPLAFYIYSAEELPQNTSEENAVTNPQDFRLVRTSDAKLRRVILPTSQFEADVIDFTYDLSGQTTKTDRYKQPIVTSGTGVTFSQNQQPVATLSVEQTGKDEYQRTTEITATCNDITLVDTYTYESFISDKVISQSTKAMSENKTYGTVQTDYTADTLSRLEAVKVTVSGVGYAREISYVPRMSTTQQGPGIIEPWQINPTKPSIVPLPQPTGTTYYPSSIKSKEIRGNSVITVHTENITYDDNGNIASYGGTSYLYDKLNRLVRENNFAIDKTIIWEYDVGGNITSRKEYAYTTSNTLGAATNTYTYSYGSGWKDQLTSFGGKACVYDLAGNPTTYKGDTLSWEGRLLKTYQKQNESATVSMNYTADGLRVSKTVGNSSTSHYIYNGTTLVQERTVTSSGTKYITFLYNGEGLTGFVYDNTLYTYRKNLFGDIIAVYQGSTKVAEYAYDAYGKCTVILNTAGIATINPFRYRSYYFDSDLGLYYLQSRYYDPETGRFINADDVSYLDPQSIHGLNLYAYCLNNPVMYVDPSGHFLDWILDIISIAWSAYDFIKTPSWENAGWLALDIVLGILPFIPSIGKGINGLTKVDDFVDIGKGISRLDDVHDTIVIGNGMDRVRDAAKLHNATFYAGFTPLNDLAEAGRISDATVKMKFLARIDNFKWLMNHILSGARIIDIGKDGRNIFKWFISAYGMERRILFYWWHSGHFITRLIRIFR